MSAECIEYSKLAMEIITTAATVGIFIVGWRQMYLIRQEAKRERTLNICFAYDSDPVISECVKAYRNSKKQNPDSHESITLLNYFDVIAIGAAQGNYDFEIIYHQFKNIIPDTSNELNITMKSDKYPDLINLIEKIETRKRQSNAASI